MRSDKVVYRKRIWVISSAIILFALLCITRLFFLQIIHGSAYEAEGEDQYVRVDSDVFDRGSIFFKTKSGALISAGTITTGYKLVMNPRLLEDKEATYTSLLTVLPDIDHDTFMESAGKSTTYREVALKLGEDTKKKIDALDLPGIQTLKYKWRSYPGGDLGAHLLGFVGYKDRTLTGRYGVEQYYNDTLSRNEDALYINFFAEVFARLDTTHSDGGKEKGDLVLSIEPVVQAQLEKSLEEVKTKWNSDSVGGLVIDPTTGRIIAMANRPVFDPNSYEDEEDLSVFPNTLTERVFEMGSVIKPIVMASAIDAGVVTPETSYYDGGSVVVEGKTIYNFDKKGRGQATMQDVLGESLNTGMVFVADKMGGETMRNYLYGFGFNQKTGVDLPNETRNLVENLESPRKIEYATASFGQGIALSPISAVRAFSALANGGYLVTPHIVDAIVTNDVLGTQKKLEYEKGPQAITPETSETITKMLVHNVDDYYGSGSYKLEHYSIAAKTGTAQIPNKEAGGYYEDRHLHTFFGYFPAYQPRFLIFLYNMNPKGIKYASQTLLPPFMDTARFMISYYDVPPDR